MIPIDEATLMQLKIKTDVTNKTVFMLDWCQNIRVFSNCDPESEREMNVEEFDDTIGKLPRSGNRCSRQLSVRLYTSESLEPQISGEAGRHSRAIALSVTTA